MLSRNQIYIAALIIFLAGLRLAFAWTYQPLLDFGFLELLDRPATEDPRFTRLASLSFHYLNAVLIFFLLCKLTKHLTASLVGAFAFAFHPLNVEAIAWSACLNILVASAFGFLSLLCITFSSSFSAFASWVFYGLAIVAHPAFVALPLVTFSVLCFQGRLPKESAAALRWQWMLGATVMVVLFLTHRQKPWIDQFAPLWSVPILGTRLVAFYIQKAFFPVHLAADYGLSRKALLETGFTYIFFVLALISLPLLRFASRKIVCALLIFTAALIPSFGFFPVESQLYSYAADHYCYFALTGLSLLLALVVSKFRRQHLAYVAFAIPVALGWMTTKQIPRWKNTEALLQHSVQLYPHGFASHVMLAQLAAQNRNDSLAQQHLEKARVIDPESQFVRVMLARYYEAKGNSCSALLEYEQLSNQLPKVCEFKNAKTRLLGSSETNLR